MTQFLAAGLPGCAGGHRRPGGARGRASACSPASPGRHALRWSRRRRTTRGWCSSGTRFGPHGLTRAAALLTAAAAIRRREPRDRRLERVQEEAGAELRLEPGRLRGHDLPGVADGRAAPASRWARARTPRGPRPGPPGPAARPCPGCRPRTRCAGRAAGRGCRGAGRAPRPGGWRRRARRARRRGSCPASPRASTSARRGRARSGAGPRARDGRRADVEPGAQPLEQRGAPARTELLHQPVVGEDLQRLVRRRPPRGTSPPLPRPAPGDGAAPATRAAAALRWCPSAM